MNSFDQTLAVLAIPFAVVQALLALMDEYVFHRARVLGEWESWSHVSDSAGFAAALVLPAVCAATTRPAVAYACAAVLSTALVTKDEWIHARECDGAEQWLHALLFAIHPCVLVAVGALWSRGEGMWLRGALPLTAAA